MLWNLFTLPRNTYLRSKMALNGTNAGNVENTSEVPPKRRKIEEDPETPNSVNTTLKDLSAFELERIISESSERKNICLYGKFRDTLGEAVVLLEKRPFDEENVRNILKEKCPVDQQFSNDIYGNYLCKINADLNDIKLTVIHPATEKHVNKFGTQIHHLVEETPELYELVTLPHLQKEQFNLQWITNILEHKSEVERIVFEDSDPETGFILVPDLKWDGKQVENLYLIAIVRKHGILSLRDLRKEHLEMLKNVLEKGTKAVEDKYKLPRSRQRVYFHYQPSFYHLHIHFTNIGYDAPGTRVEKSHLLQTVISNLELVGDYYKKAILPFSVKENDNLFKCYEDKGIVKRFMT